MEEKPNNSQFHIRLPIFLAISICVGMLIGANMSIPVLNLDNKKVAKQSNKFRDILNYVERYYVDTVNSEKLVEHAISEMLTKLDPHTIYVPPRDYALTSSQLKSNFEGVGIEFSIFRDTLQVVATVSGGPSDQVGIQAGDKIIKVDGETIAGVKTTNRKVIDLLRGKKGSKVTVKVKRGRKKELLSFTITRGKIPNFTVDVSYMLDEKTGYIKLSRFGSTTHKEFKKALAKLYTKGMTQLVFDLRDNGGGYLDMAVAISDEFLTKEKKIVYTKGKGKHANDDYFATSKGEFEEGTLIVLVNENSASASEIVAGAIQDNDRGLIVGRRSFGKGLVQKPIQLQDKSELRLTIARYYTPSGRCIQKPYKNYGADIHNRALHGEFFSADSVHFNDSLKYETLGGRTVYGGGGVMPDFFVPKDTTFYSSYLTEILSKNLLREFAYDYANEQRETLKKDGLKTFTKSFLASQKIEKAFINFVTADGVAFKKKEYEISKAYIFQNIKAFIARGVWNDDGFYPIYQKNDNSLKNALKLFSKAKELQKNN